MHQESAIQSQSSKEVDQSRKDLIYIGLALFSLLVITIALQLVLNLLVTDYAPQLFDHNWFIWIVLMAPLYLAAYPVCLLIMKKVPAASIQLEHLDVTTFLMYAMIAATLMYAGNIIGIVFTTLLDLSFNLEDVNELQDLILNSSLPANLLFGVILVPVAEEFLFRKVLIDRTLRFGEGTAIMMSALFFGLFHGNFTQFFYAFGLGALFAFIYIRTGRLRYVIALHMWINFPGVVLVPFVLSRLDMDMLLTQAQNNPEQINSHVLLEKMSGSMVWLIVLGLYMFLVLGLALGGLILLIIKRKSFKLQKNESSLQGKNRFTSIWLNPGILLFLAGCVVLFAYNLLMV